MQLYEVEWVHVEGQNQVSSYYRAFWTGQKKLEVGNRVKSQKKIQKVPF